MTFLNKDRSKLLLGCGAGALALSLALSPQVARAQAIQATPTVVQGSATIDRNTPGQDTVTVASQVAVIDWTPDEDGGGNALDFLPTGTTAIFQDTPGQGGFSVLNRILPATNGNIAVFDGLVLSQLIDGTGGASPGGFVAFYSPTGILVGPNAVFDVGSLMLTTLDPDLTSFTDFAVNGGTMSLTGAPLTSAPILIDPTALVLAGEENSFFAAVGAEVQMLGTSIVNGSQAFVGAESVNLTFSNGLFDIVINTGSSSPNPVTLLGDIGGPSSTGAGDNHMIYGVAAGATNPISMLVGGNLGFAPAANASIVNGEIILSANYNVSGRNVAGGSVSDGINAAFPDRDAASIAPGDIFLTDVASSSSMLAISNGLVDFTTIALPGFIDGNLMLVGRQSADLQVDNGQLLDITGDLLISSRAFGVVGASLIDPNAINAQGGNAFLSAINGATLNVFGNALVTADAFSGLDLNISQVGTATGGLVGIAASDATITVGGDLIGSAIGDGLAVLGLGTSGADAFGGLVQLISDTNGNIIVGNNLVLDASAAGADTDQINPSTGSNAFGGSTAVNVSGGSLIDVGFGFTADASAQGGAANAVTAQNGGTAGTNTIFADTSGNFLVGGTAFMFAQGIGGDNIAGQAGVGIGGGSNIDVFGNATVRFGNLNATSTATGGNGLIGGDGIGGLVAAFVETGLIEVAGSAVMQARGVGGDGIVGGDGGNGFGGTAQLRSDGDLVVPGIINIVGNLGMNVDGVGGAGSNGDGALINAGAGGNGAGGNSATPNIVTADFSNGAYILATSDYGAISVGGTSTLQSIGFGGNGGFGGTGQIGGDGGIGTGGSVLVALDLLGFSGTDGLGTIDLADLVAVTAAVGGNGGFGTSFGNAGAAFGGNVDLQAVLGAFSAANVSLLVQATGGNGLNAGDGNGGSAAVFGDLDGQMNLASLLVDATGTGGDGIGGLAGNGQGGSALIDLTSLALQVNGATAINASAFGGTSDSDNGGDAFGGNADLSNFGPAGSAILNGPVEVLANAEGGAAASGFIGGSGFGGTAFVSLTATDMTIGGGGTLVIAANGAGGSSDTQVGTGGAGSASLSLDSSALIADGILVSSTANSDAVTGAAVGGNAFGGSTSVSLFGTATLDTQLLEILASATTAVGGVADGGFAGLSIGDASPATISAGTINLFADASGADPAALANASGGFAIDILGGQVSTGNLTASALGDVLPAAELFGNSITAAGGDLLISGAALIDSFDSIDIATGQGNIIGGPSLAAPTATIAVRSQNTITFSGDNDGFISFGGDTLDLVAREVNIELGARIGANSVTIQSLDTVDAAIIGGLVDELGFTLTSDEAERIEASNFAFFAPSIVSADPNAADIIIRDITAIGSEVDGTSNILVSAIDPDGILRVEGQISVIEAAATDRLELAAGDRIEILTPVGIDMTNLAGELSGTLALTADNIWIADAGMIAQLQADPNFATRNEELALAAVGSEDPLGYIQAGGVEIATGNTFFVRNTGINGARAGILVGDGGLSIAELPSAPATGIDVFAYGQRRTAAGDFITDGDFYREVLFNRLTGTTYNDLSQLNDCLIADDTCPYEIDPVDVLITTVNIIQTNYPIYNPTGTGGPIGSTSINTSPALSGNSTKPPAVAGPESTSESFPPTTEEADESFGVDFPGTVSIPSYEENPLLDDPVTSGGDSSLYGSGDDEEDEDEEGGE